MAHRKKMFQHDYVWLLLS